MYYRLTTNTKANIIECSGEINVSEKGNDGEKEIREWIEWKINSS